MKKVILIIFTLLWAFNTQLVDASNEFLADYEITYVISETGETTVKQVITLTNLENDVIATGYTLNIKQIKVYDVKGSDQNGTVETKVEEQEDTTNVSASLNDYIIGEGRQNKITLEFKTKDIANKVGRIWNINIPQSKVPETTAIYNVTISVPESLGSKIFISPAPTIEEKLDTSKNTVYHFTKETIGDTPLTAAFGEFQILNYKLTYQIENPNFFSSKYEIALPSDIKHYQQVSYSNMDPKPNKMYIDKDDNLIATYTLKPHEKKEVVINGIGKISGTQINPKLGGKFEDIPSNLNSYLKSQKYWEVDSIEVKNVSNKILMKNKNVTENARAIYQYLTDNYKYDFDIVNQSYVDRKGAQQALSRQNSLACMEFTDLFISIARSMGIPAREINGFALSDDTNLKPLSIVFDEQDSLHAWPEFYDPYYGWIQVDPTWGSTSKADYFTKLDTSHFAFVRKGYSSEYPLPAGAYRFDNDTDLVDVEFSQSDGEQNITQEVKLTKTINLNIFKLLKGQSRYFINNTGNSMIYTEAGVPIAPGSKLETFIDKNSNILKLNDYNGNAVEKSIKDIT